MQGVVYGYETKAYNTPYVDISYDLFDLIKWYATILAKETL